MLHRSKGTKVTKWEVSAFLIPIHFPSLEAITVKSFLCIIPDMVYAFIDIYIDGVFIHNGRKQWEVVWEVWTDKCELQQQEVLKN